MRGYVEGDDDETDNDVADERGYGSLPRHYTQLHGTETVTHTHLERYMFLNER